MLLGARSLDHMVLENNCIPIEMGYLGSIDLLVWDKNLTVLDSAIFKRGQINASLPANGGGVNIR